MNLAKNVQAVFGSGFAHQTSHTEEEHETTLPVLVMPK
jgi:hypothetical protein